MTRTRNMTVSVLGSLVLAALVSFEARAAEKPVPTLEEIDAAITAAWAGVKTIHVRTTVHIVKDGKDHSWQETATWSDHLGRCRHEIQHGVYDEQMQRKPTTSECSIYDGKMNASFDYNYSYNKGAKKGDGSRTHVDLFDGRTNLLYGSSTFPVKNSPLSVIDASRTIKSEENQELKISWIADSDQLQIDYIRPAELRHALVIDPTKNWMWLSHRTFDLDGKITAARAVEGAHKSGPYWIPMAYKSAHMREAFIPRKFWDGNKWDVRLQPDGKPVAIRIPPSNRSASYDLVEIDHDDFDHSKFDIILKQGMYVWDGRFKVDYVVRDETLRRDDLERAAKEAIERQK